MYLIIKYYKDDSAFFKKGHNDHYRHNINAAIFKINRCIQYQLVVNIISNICPTDIADINDTDTHIRYIS